jgi:co-chaperonin GroES (HSP10)
VRTKSWDSKAFRPCDVKVGDIVHLAGLEIGGYLHTTIRWGHKTVVVCREEDIAGIETEVSAMPESGGFSAPRENHHRGSVLR